MTTNPNIAEPTKPRRRWTWLCTRALLVCATLVVSILCTAGVLHVWHSVQHRADESKQARLGDLLDKKLDALPRPAVADDPRQLGEKSAMEDPGWKIEITGGLNAHFKQPDGPSKPGTDWAVSLKRGPEVHRILVRSYARGDGKISQQQEIGMVLHYVAGLVGRGWMPGDVKGVPDELILPLDNSPSN